MLDGKIQQGNDFSFSFELNPQDQLKEISFEILDVDIEAVFSDEVFSADCNGLPTTNSSSPNNPLLMASIFDDNAAIKVEINDTNLSEDAFSRLLVGVRRFEDTNVINSVKPVRANSSMRLEFDALSGPLRYDIIAGFDLNGNGDLDSGEVGTVFQKTPVGNSSQVPPDLDRVRVVTAQDYERDRILLLVGSSLYLTYAGDILDYFASGSAVPQAQVGTTQITSDDPRLTHPVGAVWDQNCNADILVLTYNVSSDPSQDVLSSNLLSETIDKSIQLHKASIIQQLNNSGSSSGTINIPIENLPDNLNDFGEWDGALSSLDRAFGGVVMTGSLDVNCSLASFGSNINVSTVEVVGGQFEDLYDFNYENAPPSNWGATVQAGYPSLHDPAVPGGRIFEIVVNFGGNVNVNKTF